MAMVYALVARGHQTILSSYTSCSGNFQNIAFDVLKKSNLSKTFGQFATVNYNFYTFIKQGFVFLVMVASTYETRIAINFLKQIQQIFFARYQQGKRNTLISHSLKDFDKILQDKIQLYSDKTKVDKLSSLKKQLTDFQQQSLKNMDKIIDRGQKIEILVKKSQILSDQSYDLKTTANKVKKKMWWKNKKIMLAIILIIILIIFLIIGFATSWKFGKS